MTCPQETFHTLARYVDVVNGFVPSLAQQAIEHDAKGEGPDRAALAEAVSALRVGQRRLGAAMKQLLDYQDGIG